MIDNEKLGTPAFWDQLRDNPEALAREICKIDAVNMEKTLERHASLRAWVSAAYESAKIMEERAKWELTKVRARVYQEAKSEDDPDTGKGKTVATLEAEVDSHPDVEAATQSYLDAGAVKGALRGMNNGMEDRKDMLQQISANQRREFADQR